MLTGASKIIRATFIADNSPTMKDNYEKANAKSERFARFYNVCCQHKRSSINPDKRGLALCRPLFTWIGQTSACPGFSYVVNHIE